MRNRPFAFCFAIWILLLWLSPTASAKEEPLGRFVAVTGEVKLKKAKQVYWSDAALNMRVFFGDTVRTEEDSKSTIKLVDDSIIQVQSNSQVVLNTIISPVEKKNSVLLFFGRIWNKVSKKALRKKVFEVQTPTAVCGVRGTDFETASYDDGTMLVRVNTGRIEVDNETTRATLATNQGTQISFDQKEIRAESDFKPDWEKDKVRARENLFADGRKYGGYVHDEIYKRRDHLKQLVDRAADLAAEKKQLKAAAVDAQEREDTLAYESYMTEIKAINVEQRKLNKQIAYYGRRLECHFGLFSHYGDLAKHPELSKRFKGKEFILNQLDNIESIHAEFNEMIEEGMKMSMEDMEDLMDEMRDKMKDYKEKKASKSLFDQLD